jgi:hypothetical protein
MQASLIRDHPDDIESFHILLSSFALQFVYAIRVPVISSGHRTGLHRYYERA